MAAPADGADAAGVANADAEALRRVLTIQSHTVRGYVGNKAAVFPLQLLGTRPGVGSAHTHDNSMAHRQPQNPACGLWRSRAVAPPPAFPCSAHRPGG
jgi:hypothetical protein